MHYVLEHGGQGKGVVPSQQRQSSIAMLSLAPSQDHVPTTPPQNTTLPFNSRDILGSCRTQYYDNSQGVEG